MLIICFRLRTISVICTKKFRRSSTRHTGIVRRYWKDIQSVVEVMRKPTFKNKGKEQIEQEVSYYITSLRDDVKEAARAIRNHWAIETSQHWLLDVRFREDESQIYAEDGAKNMALFRRALLNLIKAHPLKDSVAGKMMRASRDSKLRAKILFGQKPTKVSSHPALVEKLTYFIKSPT